MLPALPIPGTLPLLKYNNYKDFLYWFSKAYTLLSLCFIAWIFISDLSISTSFKKVILSIYTIIGLSELLVSMPFWKDKDLDTPILISVILLPTVIILISKVEKYVTPNYRRKYIENQNLIEEIHQHINDLSENQCKKLSLSIDNLLNLPDYLTQQSDFELLRGETKGYSENSQKLLAQIELKFKLLTLKTNTNDRY